MVIVTRKLVIVTGKLVIVTRKLVIVTRKLAIVTEKAAIVMKCRLVEVVHFNAIRVLLKYKGNKNKLSADATELFGATPTELI